MFGFLKKSIHEPLDIQRRDLGQSAAMLEGADCDEVPGASGPLGSLTNPIPVNGAVGELKYLVKLRGSTGEAVMFHRLGSVGSPVTENPVDLFEVVCLDATQWNRLYFDCYHPRRSNFAPPGYTLMPYSKDLKMDLPFGFGITGIVENFPHGIPLAVQETYGEMGEALARRITERLRRHTFTRPAPKPQAVTAHILDPNAGYLTEEWAIGRHVSEEMAARFSEKGNVFVVVQYEAGNPKATLCSRQVWEEVKANFDAIDNVSAKSRRNIEDELRKLR